MLLNKFLTKNIFPAINNVRYYNPLIMEHYENPRNMGKFENNDKNHDEHIVSGLVGSPACGDVMRLQLKIDENGFIKDARFKTFGCGSAIASSSFSTELVKNKNIHEAQKIKNQEIAKHLSLQPLKFHCSMLAEDAIKDAIRNYKKQTQVSK